MKEEEQIEADIKEKGLNAPRLSPGDIDEVVVSEEFILMPSGKAMVCELTLRNGFTVRGESACVSRENFDDDIGRKISYANARNKVWELEGYLLQDILHSSRKIDASVARICHEVNRAYCEALGDTSQVSWEDAPSGRGIAPSLVLRCTSITQKQVRRLHTHPGCDRRLTMAGFMGRSRTLIKRSIHAWSRSISFSSNSRQRTTSSRLSSTC